MIELVLVILAVVAGLYWLEAVRSKDVAAVAARKYCGIRDVQLLDQTVHQIKLSLSRDQHDRWRVWRLYRFEYSRDGVERCWGYIKMLGPRVLSVELDIDPIEVH